MAFDFHHNVAQALKNDNLQEALQVMKRGFVEKRAKAKERLPEFEALRSQAVEVKSHVLANLDIYLRHYEAQVTSHGGQVHWARDAATARAHVLAICRRHNAKSVTKSKSMVGEEIALNHALSENGIIPIETDLGEYIIQLRQESPSHIIAPALHVLKREVAELFYTQHSGLAKARRLHSGADLVHEARLILRQKYLCADIGITGANFLIAENGASVIVTNEGNGDLTQILPRVHIVVAGIEKLVATMNDATVLLRLLARSATGQEFSSYTTFSAGNKRADELDGPSEYHVILLDNGRCDLLASEFAEVLRCIRCGACMNHCPVYTAIGGHAYGGVYPGPIGAALTPALLGLQATRDLPHASSFCGRCEEVCPVKIPLTSIMRQWRRQDFAYGKTNKATKSLLRLWASIASRPRLYRIFVDAKISLLRLLSRHRRIVNLRFLRAWQKYRNLPAPQSRKSFISQYHQNQRRQKSCEKGG